MNPGLQALEGFVVAFVDLRDDGVEVRGVCGRGTRPARKCESGGSAGGSLKKGATVGHFCLH